MIKPCERDSPDIKQDEVKPMNILFLTIGTFDSINQHSVYTDLLRKFAQEGHQVYVVCSREKRMGLPTELFHEGNAQILKVRIGNITKTNLIEKGISTLRIEKQYINAIEKYFKGVKFDLILYSTPPITLAGTIRKLKKRDGAKTYLMLKDIFPQNAVDIGMMKKTGVKSILYRYFRGKEKKLYDISDWIGCMSPANVDYVLKNNTWIDPEKLEICANTIEPQDLSVDQQEREALREKYRIPLDKKVFVYGGNLGKPQGIPFLIDCLKGQISNPDAYFLIVGDGTEFGKLEQFFNEHQPDNMKLLQKLPKEDYDRMVAACDVGLIFLDYRFTIPNFPSRLLSYMQAKLPTLCCTDPNTDVGTVCVDGGFGWWCESNNPTAFAEKVEAALSADLSAMGEKAFAYMLENYHVDSSFDAIMQHMAETLDETKVGVLL